MAQAQVTLKVSPAELQVIDDSLRMYAHVSEYLLAPQGRKRPLEGFKRDARGSNIEELLIQTNKIRRDIGLK